MHHTQEPSNIFISENNNKSDEPTLFTHKTNEKEAAAQARATTSNFARRPLIVIYSWGRPAGCLDRQTPEKNAVSFISQLY